MQQLLENILNALCKATSRDIFVMLPAKEKDRMPYLIKEIKITLDKVAEQAMIEYNTLGIGELDRIE